MELTKEQFFPISLGVREENGEHPIGINVYATLVP